MKILPRQYSHPAQTGPLGHVVASQDPALGIKIASGFIVMVFLFSVVGSFVVYHLWSGQGARGPLTSASLMEINSATEIDQYATNLLVACERYSVTLDTTDAEAAKVSLDSLKQAVNQAKTIPPYQNVPEFKDKVDQIQEKIHNYETSFDAFTDSTAEMGDALSTMVDTEESFPKYVEKIIPSQLALYDDGQVKPEDAPKIKRRMEIVYDTLSHAALVTRLTSEGYAERKEAKIEVALRTLTDIDTEMEELLSITPEVRVHDPNIQRKDDLSQAQAQGTVLHNYVKFFVISWKSMETAKVKCTTTIQELQVLCKDIATHSGQNAANEATIATKTVERYSRLTLFCVAGLAVLGLVGAFFFANMIISGLNPNRRTRLVK